MLCRDSAFTACGYCDGFWEDGALPLAWGGMEEQASGITCKRCRVAKSWGYFARSTRSKSGYRAVCTPCLDAEAKAQRRAEEERLRQEAAEAFRYAGRALLCCNERYARTLNGRQFVYALRDTRTGKTRYVGRSTNPSTRLSSHWRDARTEGVCGSSLDHWLGELRAVQMRPDLTILEEVAAPATAWEREARWILHLLHEGSPLTNSDARCPQLVTVVRATALDYLHEPLESEAWLPFYAAWRRDRSNWDQARRGWGSHEALGLTPCAACQERGFRCGVPRPGGWPGGGATDEEFAASYLLDRYANIWGMQRQEQGQQPEPIGLGVGR